MLILENFIYLVVVDCVILYPLNAHQVHLNRKSKWTCVHCVTSKVTPSHRECIFGLLIHTIRILGRILMEDVESMLAPIIVLRVVVGVLTHYEVLVTFQITNPVQTESLLYFEAITVLFMISLLPKSRLTERFVE